MARGGVNKALVQKARLSLMARGEHPSIDAVRIEMGNTGSKTTIHRYLKELEETDTPAHGIDQELTELVAHLAGRIQGQAQERIDQAQAQHVAELEKLETQLASARRQADDQATQIIILNETTKQQASALLRTEEALREEQIRNLRMTQVNQDLETRLMDKQAHILSLEEKHQHAREALEHYRNAVKEQRDQDQRRHEGQVQQLQMELRQAQQSLMMRQEDITQLNRDNERLLIESRATLRDLGAQREACNKATAEATQAAQQHQHAQTQCALLEERLRVALQDSAGLKQSLTDTQQQNRVLELLLTKKEVALEALRKAAVAPDGAEATGQGT